MRYCPEFTSGSRLGQVHPAPVSYTHLEQNGWDADSSVLNYLSGSAQLQLNIPESDWPGGLTITVSNDLCTSVVCNLSLIHIFLPEVSFCKALKIEQ